MVVNTDRAEPTTEYVAVKRSADIPPFGGVVYVAHNGTIANDKELEAKYSLERRSRVDTSLLPPLLEKIWDGSFKDLQRILCDVVVGSYALAVVDSRKPNTLYLACNYKPLYLEYDRRFDALFFTSLETYLQQRDTPLWISNPVRQMKPYSIMMVSTDKVFEEDSLWRVDSDSTVRRRRALVVCSGGLDSTVATKVMMDRGFDVTLLHFKYRHRAERREAESIGLIADTLGCGLMTVDTALFKEVIGHSRLTETYGAVVTEGEGEAGAEFAHEWVPARNLIFLSIAVGIAEAQDFGTVVLGNNLEEAGAYPDNEMIFIEKLNEVLPYATNYQKRVRLEMPVGNLMKREIVKLGVEIDAPLEYTWSCYEGGEMHCGICGPCYMRRTGFRINGLKDPVKYQADEPEAS